MTCCFCGVYVRTAVLLKIIGVLGCYGIDYEELIFCFLTVTLKALESFKTA